jgi:hypothetical protein
MEAILSVFHQHETGWHTYTSPQLPGLFLTGPDEDARALSDALPSTICALIEAADQRAVSIRQAESYRGGLGTGHNIAARDVLHFLVTSAGPEASNSEVYPARQDNGSKARRRSKQG